MSEASSKVPDHRSNRAAFFDIDNTIIRGAAAFHLGKRMYKQGYFKTRDLIRFSFHLARYLVFGENRSQIEQVRNRALSIVRNRTVAEMTAIGTQVYDEVLAHRIWPGTRKLLDGHLEAGDQVWLISATPVEISELIAHKLGATGALGTVAEREDGVYTGRLVGDLMHGQAKADAVRELAERLGLDLAESSAYGDSINDFSMLELVGHPCAINPEPRLRRYAARVGWPVRDFRGRRRATRNGARAAGAAWVVALIVGSILRRVRRK